MRLSIVDISVVPSGASRTDAFRQSIDLAQHAERWAYARYWVAEHHGSPSVAGRAPEVLIAAIAARTSSIRLGSGSVLLNHYSPFKVAEVFCTLNELYPGRIDLGAGRATTGAVTDLALQQDRTRPFRADSDQQILELVAWLERGFPEDHPFAGHPVHTIDSLPELHLLGSPARPRRGRRPAGRAAGAGAIPAGERGATPLPRRHARAGGRAAGAAGPRPRCRRGHDPGSRDRPRGSAALLRAARRDDLMHHPPAGPRPANLSNQEGP